MLGEGYYFSNDLIELLQSKRCLDSYGESLDKLQKIKKIEHAAWDVAFFIVKRIISMMKFFIFLEALFHTGFIRFSF